MNRKDREGEGDGSESPTDIVVVVVKYYPTNTSPASTATTIIFLHDYTLSIGRHFLPSPTELADSYTAMAGITTPTVPRPP